MVHRVPSELGECRRKMDHGARGRARSGELAAAWGLAVSITFHATKGAA